MSRRCDICGKGPTIGNMVSHAKNSSKKRVFPNLHRVRIIKGKTNISALVCTKCIKKGKIAKAVKTRKPAAGV